MENPERNKPIALYVARSHPKPTTVSPQNHSMVRADYDPGAEELPREASSAGMPLSLTTRTVCPRTKQ